MITTSNDKIDVFQNHLFKLFALMSFCIVSSIFLASIDLAYAQNSLYSIHVASCQNIHSAEKNVSMLKRKGYKAFHRHETVTGKGKWYRIYIGKFKTKNEAKTKADFLKSIGDISYSKLKILEDIEQEKAIKDEELIFGDDDVAEAEISNKSPGIMEEKKDGIITESISPPHPLLVDKEAIKPDQARQNRKLILDKTEKELERIVAEAEKEINSIETAAKREEKREFQLEEKDVESKITHQSETKDDYNVESKNTDAEEKETRTVQYGQSDQWEDINKDDLDKKFLDKSRKSWFSLDLKTGTFLSINVEDFTLTQIGTPLNDVWEISGNTALEITITPTLRFNNFFSIENGFTTIVSSGIDLNFFSISPKLSLNSSKMFFPYFKAGVIYGTFSWDDVPGDFDNGVGWETGLGCSFLQSPFKIGSDLSYRNIKFDYDAPTGLTIISNDGSIDFSGFTFSVFISFFF